MYFSANYCAAFLRWRKWWCAREGRLTPWQEIAKDIRCRADLTDICRLEILLYITDWCSFRGAHFFREFAQDPDLQKLWQERDEWLRTTVEKIAQGDEEKRYLLHRSPWQVLRIAPTLPVRAFLRAHDSMCVDQAKSTLNLCSVVLEEFELEEVLSNSIVQQQVHNIFQWCEMAFRVVTPEQAPPIPGQMGHIMCSTRIMRDMNCAIEKKKQRVTAILSTFVKSLDLIRHVILPYVGL